MLNNPLMEGPKSLILFLQVLFSCIRTVNVLGSVWYGEATNIEEERKREYKEETGDVKYNRNRKLEGESRKNM